MRQKTVFNADGVIDAYISGATDAKTSNRNLYIEGDTLYSYGQHWPIVHRVTNGDNRTLYFYNTAKSSATTNKHAHACRLALRYHKHAEINCDLVMVDLVTFSKDRSLKNSQVLYKILKVTVHDTIVAFEGSYYKRRVNTTRIRDALEVSDILWGYSRLLTFLGDHTTGDILDRIKGLSLKVWDTLDDVGSKLKGLG